jgi:hypothetical protein
MIHGAVHGNAVAPGPVVPSAAAQCAVALSLALQSACTAVRPPPPTPSRWLEHADDAERAATHCTGRDGALVFSARLQGTGPDSTTDLAIVVYEAHKH